MSLLCLPMLSTACGGSVGIDPKPVLELRSALATPPPALSAECGQAAELPAGAMSAGAVERAWAADRAALGECRLKHKGIVEMYDNVRRGLAGK